MKHLLVILMTAISLGFMPSPETNSGSLIIELEEIDAPSGEVEVSLYDNDQKFLVANGAIITKRQKVNNQKIQVIFDNIPFGSYAAVSYHDVNENHQIDRNFVGIPKEPVAVSKVYKKQFKKPEFQEAKIDFNHSNMTIKMKFIKY